MPVFKKNDNSDNIETTQEIGLDTYLDIDKLSDEIVTSIGPSDSEENDPAKSVVDGLTIDDIIIDENASDKFGDGKMKIIPENSDSIVMPKKFFGSKRGSKNVTPIKAPKNKKTPAEVTPEEAIEKIIPEKETDKNEISETDIPKNEINEIHISEDSSDKNDSPEKELRQVPDVKTPRTRRYDKVMSMNIDILTVLIPIVAWAVYVFGLRVLSVVASAVAFSVISELAVNLLLHREKRFTDLAPIINGIIISLFLPVTVPLWIPAVAALISNVFVRGLIRAYGDCRLDPVASAVCSVSILFPAALGTLCKAFDRVSAFSVSAPQFEKISETSLDILAKGIMPRDSLWACIFGLRSGAIGEVSVILLVAAAVYLTVRKVIKPVLPLTFVATLGVLCYFFPRVIIESDAIAIEFTAYNLVTGNLLLAVIFAAAFPGVSPLTKGGSFAAGVIGGAVTYAVRYFLSGVYADALVAVLIISVISRPLDKLFIPAAFGGGTKPRRKEKSTGENAA